MGEIGPQVRRAEPRKRRAIHWAAEMIGEEVDQPVCGRGISPNRVRRTAAIAGEMILPVQRDGAGRMSG